MNGVLAFDISARSPAAVYRTVNDKHENCYIFVCRLVSHFMVLEHDNHFQVRTFAHTQDWKQNINNFLEVIYEIVGDDRPIILRESSIPMRYGNTGVLYKTYGVIERELENKYKRVIEIPPRRIKESFTGDVRANKFKMRQTLQAEYSDIFNYLKSVFNNKTDRIPFEDIVDAFALCTMIDKTYNLEKVLNQKYKHYSVSDVPELV
jgi:hypothetical protein